MKVIGISRVRNESHMIKDTLDHVASLVDEVVICDEASEDDTPAICEAHPSVAKVIRHGFWDPTPMGRMMAEGYFRQLAYQEALARGADWVYCFDADEFLELDEIHMPDRVVPKPDRLADLVAAIPEVDSFMFRLFDFYITKADVDGTWKDRRMMGPEYRDILMFFRASPHVQFQNREPSGIAGAGILGGWVRHYGKAISIEHWEQTCDYYVNHRGGDKFPQFAVKWAQRRGKAVHEKSDFGADLITWDERETRGVPLKDDPKAYLPPAPDGVKIVKYGS